MNNRNRGWKGSRRNVSGVRKRSRKTHKYLPGEGLLRRFLGAFFVFIMNIVIWTFRWIFKRKGFWRRIIRFGIVTGLILFIWVGTLFVFYSFAVPDPNKLVERTVAESTKILDRNGEPLYEIYGEAKRTLISLEEIPDIVKQAAIAVEDKNFYSHKGISITGIARAAMVNILTASKRQGASTITQQFVRNAILTREKTFTRKIKEIILAVQLENNLTKDEILQLYLNEIPFGSNAYGIEAASQTFFGKTSGELVLIEAAYLASLPKAPTYYSPYGPNREDLDNRADTVLQLMYEQGYITEVERNQAQNQEVEFKEFGTGIIAPHFVLFVQDLLAQKYGELGLQEGGFVVTTTLDLEMQKAAEEAVANQADRNEKEWNASNASLVAIDPKTGQILAMVGSRDFFNEDIDGAVNVSLRLRQPGSSFKPYVYATAFKQGMNPATMLVDVVTDFGEFGGKSYKPHNYDNLERGPVSIRTALQGSLNIPAVKTTLLVGVENAIDTAESLGITSLKDRSRYGPSIVLGGGEIRLIEHVAAFGAFAAGGIKHETTSILKVEDAKGRVLEEWKESRGREVLDPQVAFLINHILSDNNARAFVFGPNNHLTIGRPVAAKTGTTQEFRDAWTVGYTPNLSAGVWVGNNDNTAMRPGAAGGVVAAPIWNEFMRLATANLPVEDFARPEGIVEIVVDSLSGKLPSAYTPSTKTEVFASFNVPTMIDDVHIPIIISGETRIFTSLHSQMPDQPNWEEPVRRWADANGFPLPPSEGVKSQPGITIDIVSPGKITSLPWTTNIAVQTNEPILSVDLFLDNSLLTNESRQTFSFSSSDPHVDGKHQLIVRVRSSDGGISQKSTNIEFSLGIKNLLLAPSNNQTISFPENLVIESSRDVSVGDVAFRLRGSDGGVITLPGTISKQRLSNDVFYYTLGWGVAAKPGPGTYELSAEVAGEATGSATINIP